MKRTASIKKNKTFLIILVFLLLSTISLLFTHIGKPVMYRGDDIYFHLSRIEGISEGIKNGLFFQKINYFFLHGMGYASPIFYSDLFLYPAGILRCLGISISNTYIIFLWSINFLTYLLAYQCFRYYKKIDYQAFLFAVLYGGASYRLSDLTERAAIGELLSFMFIPLAFIGLWSIFFEEKQKYYILSIGMACLIFTHVLSAFIFSIFIFFYLIMNLTTLMKNKKRLFALLKAVGLTVLLCLGFLLPIVEQTFDQSFNFQVNQVAKMSDFTHTIPEYIKIALVNSGVNNLGILIFLLFMLLLVRFNALLTDSKKLFLITFLFLVSSTSLIPYRLLEDTFINSVQFPWRFFVIVTFGVCWLFADNIDRLFKRQTLNKMLLFGSITLATGLLILHGLFISDTSRYVSREEVEAIPQNFLGWGMEYLPFKTDYFEVIEEPRRILNSDNVSLQNVSFEYGGIDLYYSTKKSNEEAKIILPYIYYKGYKATVDGEPLEVNNSSVVPGLCEVNVTDSGNLKMKYHWTTLQIVSFILSLLSWLTLVISLGYKKIKKKTA
ncbi:YfhO family protein [Enterococcus rivorum]|uniref:Membrane protein 6-pyruvoyl-tetrahydropterin synthase-related domain-containing protein n=1 Tax=Enterococcus rivorum TaxID=762845 RepID=A0A1E5L0Z2_9ENTE|nr:YfhO family protein [Enterococcus rivorum]MBP2098658.1 hypothetical protein [Enterococcus rivorum]OEH83753.1 hypothetical protein BCR26_07980 [Enterococcus rivorum]